MNDNTKKSGAGTIVLVLIIAVVLIAGVLFLNQPDRRTTGERIGDAAEQLGDGVKDASRELQPRTPAEKLGDAVKDVGDDIKDSGSR